MGRSGVLRADVALVGGGGAGLAVLHHLAAGTGPVTRAPLRVVVVDPLDRLVQRPADRTWCSWWAADDPVLELLAPAVHRSWGSVAVIGPDGAEQRLDLGGLRYLMVRSQDWYAAVAAAVEAAGHLEVTHLPASAGTVQSGLDGALVRTPERDVVAAAVLDSRPAAPSRPGATSLLQHFRGAQVAQPPGAAPAFDPQRAVLMDFRVPQPPVGLAFGYCLPTGARTALVEYTEFSPAVLDDAGYAAALEGYRVRVAPGEVAVEHVEQGVIPMTDAPFARRAGRRVVRLGTGGGAVRPSTGYAFAAMQRQAAALAAALRARAPVVAPRPYPRRHAWMDALLLRALADGSVDGASFFPRLFARNPPQRVLRFLDGATSPAEDLALMRTAPLPPMLASVVRDAAWRLRR